MLAMICFYSIVLPFGQRGHCSSCWLLCAPCCMTNNGDNPCLFGFLIVQLHLCSINDGLVCFAQWSNSSYCTASVSSFLQVRLQFQHGRKSSETRSGLLGRWLEFSLFSGKMLITPILHMYIDLQWRQMCLNYYP